MIAASQLFACGGDETPPETPAPNQSARPSTPAETATATTTALPTAPPSPAPFDASAPHGGLLPEQVRRVVMKHTGALRACYETVASSNPDLRGGVSVAWDIDPQGTVHNAHIIQSTISEPTVGDCVVRQIQSWQFDVSDRPTAIAQYPFKFTPVQKDAGAQ